MTKGRTLGLAALMAVLLAGTACSEQSSNNAGGAADETALSEPVGLMDDNLAEYTPQVAAPYAGTDVRISGFAGNFLASHFAQSQYDWDKASVYLDQVLSLDGKNDDLVKRAMILSVGSGDMEQAAARATQILELEPQNGLALLVIAVNDIINADMDSARKNLAAMPGGDLTAYLKPLVLGWVDAGEGKFDPTSFSSSSIHSYHAAAMALMLGNRAEATKMVMRMVRGGTLGTYDAERAADLMAALGETDDALVLYQGVQAQGVTDPDLERKVEAIKNKDEKLNSLLPPLQITTPAEGAAAAMHDMAYILFQEYSDTSAKIFANMALALNPKLTDAQLLLGDTLARNGRTDEAIAYFNSIPKDHPAYAASRRHAADLLAESGKVDEAIALLDDMFTNSNDVEALIRIGDLYREKEEYNNALEVYNRAATHIGGKTIPEEYWYLLYARGMAYERSGEWKKAEADLKGALVFRPDNPYLLNYLGYAWADQGVNLDQSLELVERALELKPSDGYITDSVGWVLYMMGRYKEAVPHLEAAVELLPYDPTINDHLGDAYWRTGRKLEARFQWQRALNHAEDDKELADAVMVKLDSGLKPDKIRAAQIDRTVIDGSAQ